MRYFIITAALLLPLLSNLTAEARSPFARVGVHDSSEMISGGCRACHQGNRMNKGITENCLQCHGGVANLEKAERRRVLTPFYRTGKSINKIDISRVFEKTYAHPVGESRGAHSAYEEMPETDAGKPRHVECTDCHHHHLMRSDEPFRGIIGVDKGGIRNTRARLEYQVCYRCHSDSYNLPVSQTNKREEFDENNPSYHPVVAEGKNSLVPSLISPYKERAASPGDISVIKCTDCHNNDDKLGLKGPHGSKYPYLLSENYSMIDNINERPFDYELCYKCHQRSNILSDISFKHSVHIEGDVSRGVLGTTCFTCHDAHGSLEYPHLIRFNENVVFANPSTGELKFFDYDGDYEGKCSLLCHGSVHNPKSYGP